METNPKSDSNVTLNNDHWKWIHFGVIFVSGIANLIMHFAHFLAHSVLSIDKPECTQPFVVKQPIITQQKKKTSDHCSNISWWAFFYSSIDLHTPRTKSTSFSKFRWWLYVLLLTFIKLPLQRIYLWGQMVKSKTWFAFASIIYAVFYFPSRNLNSTCLVAVFWGLCLWSFSSSSTRHFVSM